MRELHRRLLEAYGEERMMGEAVALCGELINAIINRRSRGELAAAIARVEIAAEWLRMIVGDHLVNEARSRTFVAIARRLEKCQ